MAPAPRRQGVWLDMEGLTAEITATTAAAVPLPPVREPSAGPETPAAQTTEPAPVRPAAPRRPPRVHSLDELPSYTRSLLHVRVPVLVTLATKRQTVKQILQLGPGSIIQFEKSCDEMLDLCVGDYRIAQGEAVKVGDKFGLRILSLAMPEERFERVQRNV